MTVKFNRGDTKDIRKIFQWSLRPLWFKFSLFPMFLWLMVVLAQAGTDAFAFLDFGVGARELSLGNAAVALTNDATSIYWNPAKLGIAKKPMLSGFYLLQPLGNWSMPNDRAMTFAFVQPFKKLGGLGLCFYQFSLGDIEYRESESSEPDTLNDTESVLYLSYGNEIFTNLAVGVNLKYYRQSFSGIQGYSPAANGFSTEFAFHFAALPKLDLGLMFQSPAKINWNDSAKTSDNIPAKAALGICYQPVNNLLLAMDIKTKEDRPLKICLGTEYSYYPFVVENDEKSLTAFKVRGGIRDVSWEKYGLENYGFTTGLGIVLALPIFEANIDYAFIYRPNLFGNSHALSFSIMF